MPRTTFLMAVYNGDRYLADSLRAILSQDCNDFDIVLVDDGSTDQTAAIIEQFNSPKIRYVAKPNGGLVSALNHGLEHIGAKYVARIDDDDICFPNRLSAQLDFITFTRAAAVASRVINVDTAGKPTGISNPKQNLLNANAGFLPAKEPYLPHPFMLIDRAALSDIGGYRNAHLAEDADLCWRLFDTHRLALSAMPLGQYRVHANSISSKSPNFGRVQAFYAQLAALNFQRRAVGQAEVAYDLSMADARDMATSVPAMVEHIAQHLSQDENDHLRAATSLKLLDLGNWRNYRLTTGDLADAQAAYAKMSGLSRSNQFSAEKTLREAAEKLAPRGPKPPSWKQRIGDRILGKGT